MSRHSFYSHNQQKPQEKSLSFSQNKTQMKTASVCKTDVNKHHLYQELDNVTNTLNLQIENHKINNVSRKLIRLTEEIEEFQQQQIKEQKNIQSQDPDSQYEQIFKYEKQQIIDYAKQTTQDIEKQYRKIRDGLQNTNRLQIHRTIGLANILKECHEQLKKERDLRDKNLGQLWNNMNGQLKRLESQMEDDQRVWLKKHTKKQELCKQQINCLVLELKEEKRVNWETQQNLQRLVEGVCQKIETELK